MKSIKEKADEYANEQDLRMAYNGSCDNCRQGFEEGANYVLEQISQALQGDLDSHSAFKLKTIKQIVEELKKK